jgi:hypothetical protein
VTRAAVDVVQPDVAAAVAFVKQARTQLASASLAQIDAESGYALCYQASIKALTGALIAVGRRVTAGEGGHPVLIREARGRTAGDATLFDRLDRMRRTPPRRLLRRARSESAGARLGEARRRPDRGSLRAVRARAIAERV